ncbi:hypothetical protein IU450_03860 [Nocardia abscessus]|uniref:hypothetical protein n=1 Tax=Nocardia abscessus TaxID=120957 RepID=UPI0018959A53|nr:hypothetical protein [Nocardia abscessus]MBF6335017.1 hypothetical protein [Nocardia abscessus]
MSLSKTVTPLRRLTRVAVAGALIAVPLAALAATASAETPADQGQVQVVDAPQGADINGRPRHFERHERHDGPGRGPQDCPGQDGPGPDRPLLKHFRHDLPPTGSS